VSGEEAGTVEVRPGRQIAWRAFGDGPPLLLINGYAATGADWDPSFLGALAAEHRVISPDNVGLGASVLADDDTVGGVEGMTADMVALLDELAIERVAIVGWSMGGFVAQSLLRAVPDRVASVGLISTHTGGPDCVDAGHVRVGIAVFVHAHIVRVDIDAHHAEFSVAVSFRGISAAR